MKRSEEGQKTPAKRKVDSRHGVLIHSGTMVEWLLFPSLDKVGAIRHRICANHPRLGQIQDLRLEGDALEKKRKREDGVVNHLLPSHPLTYND